MAHQIAKLLLEHADTFVQRSEAVELALSLGMPLREIEGYLDWLETTPASKKNLSPKGPLSHGPKRRDAGRKTV